MSDGQGSDASGLSPLARQVAAQTRAVSGRVHEHTVRTPLITLAAASEACGATILLKCEHQQKTGSFKARGALAKLVSLSAEQRERGVVAASTGNHGLGVAYALSVLGGRGLVCVPALASPVKVAAIRRYGVEVRELGTEAGETETLARALAAETGTTYLSPYNDLDVVAGQGTVGQEIVQQLGDRPVDAVVVAVGGGGLISGIGATIRSQRPGVRIIGASPANDHAMAAAVQAGHVVPAGTSPTISDGTAGSVEDGAVTLPLCTELVDEWILVREPDIAAALRLMIDTEHQLIEGAAAMALAAGLQAGRAAPGQTLAVVSCGANISAGTVAAALLSSASASPAAAPCPAETP